MKLHDCLILFLLYLEVSLGCREDRWTKETTSGARPLDRGGFSITERRGKLYLLGGVSDNLTGNLNTFFNGLYRFNPGSGRWSLIDNGSGPSPRSYHTAIYDRIRDRLVVYGGITFDATFTNVVLFDDLWEWKFTQNTWNQIFASGGPGARARHGATYLKGKMYLFSGLISSSFDAVNDLWSFDLNTDTWQQLIANGNPNSPLARNNMQFIAKNSQNRIYMNGGQIISSSFNNVNDTWVYNPVFNTWTDITPPIQFNMNPGHYEHDTSNFFGNKLYLYGGEIPGGTDGCGSIFAQNPNNETWVFDVTPGRRTWENISGSLLVTPVPLKRHGGRRVGQCLYIYGGYSWDCPGVGQTWNNEVYSLKVDCDDDDEEDED
jgi:hypothetical protein